MKQIVALAAVLVLASCGGKSAPPSQPQTVTGEGHPSTEGGSVEAPDDTRVCCESFGYGAQMVKCCESYQWTTAEECTVPPGFVGGGKQVVDGEKCGK